MELDKKCDSHNDSTKTISPCASTYLNNCIKTLNKVIFNHQNKDILIANLKSKNLQLEEQLKRLQQSNKELILANIETSNILSASISSLKEILQES